MIVIRTREGLSLPSDIPVEIRSSAAAVVQSVDFKERIVRLIVAPYGEQAVVEYRGEVLLEEIDAGAFEDLDPALSHVTANRDHDYTRTVGKAVEYDHTDTRGLVSEIFVSDTPLGDETLRLAKDGVLKASVGMLVKRSDQVVRDGVRHVKRAYLDHIAFVPNPAYAGAAVLAVRQAQQVEQGQPVPTPNLDRLMADPVIADVLAGR